MLIIQVSQNIGLVFKNVGRLLTDDSFGRVLKLNKMFTDFGLSWIVRFSYLIYLFGDVGSSGMTVSASITGCC